MRGKLLVLMGLGLAVFAADVSGATYEVQSPDGKLQAALEDGAQLALTLKVDGRTVFDKRPVGMKSAAGEFGRNATARSHETTRAGAPVKPVIDILKAGNLPYNTSTLRFDGFTVSLRLCDEAATCRFSAPSGKGVIVEDQLFERGAPEAGKVTRITVGDERVIVRGIRPEEQLWGAYQFPRPFRLGDRLAVSVHVTTDSISTYGAKALWFESGDAGQTWKEVDASVAFECGLRLQNGDRIYFPPESGLDVTKFRMASWSTFTPGYDFSKQAEEGTLPIADGMTFWMGNTTVYAYKAERLPPSLSKKEWTLHRIPAGQMQPVAECAQVDWPYLTRVVHVEGNGRKILKSIFPRGNPKLGPDGAIWVSVFSGEGHLNPANGQYSPYYSAEIFRSEDSGRTFTRRAHMEYEADGKTCPYVSGGFSDSDFEFMPDGSIVWFFRSNWYSSTGREWDPMYMARSTDNGFTWSKPVRFSDVGTLPRLCTTQKGATLVCYARPGMFVSVCENAGGTRWSEPLMLLDAGDRSGEANVKIESPVFHQWDGTCGNPELIALGDDRALLVYSDFYYPDESGVKRKTILCREITVERGNAQRRSR
jgi:hypothetical protein